VSCTRTAWNNDRITPAIEYRRVGARVEVVVLADEVVVEVAVEDLEVSRTEVESSGSETRTAAAAPWLGSSTWSCPGSISGFSVSSKDQGVRWTSKWAEVEVDEKGRRAVQEESLPGALTGNKFSQKKRFLFSFFFLFFAAVDRGVLVQIDWRG